MDAWVPTEEERGKVPPISFSIWDFAGQEGIPFPAIFLTFQSTTPPINSLSILVLFSSLFST